MANAKQRGTAGTGQGGIKRRAGASGKKPKAAKKTVKKSRRATLAKPAGKAAAGRTAKPLPPARAGARPAAKPTQRAGPKAGPKAKIAPKAHTPTRAGSRFPSVPSSLDMVRRSSAVGSGRLELADQRRKHAGMSSTIAGGDVDVDVESAYFTGDEAPGGDNPTPDQEVVDDIGRALGVEYQDAEELRGSEKVTERDRHRWELDPASSEDYRNRK
jgi:hypothetical protein